MVGVLPRVIESPTERPKKAPGVLAAGINSEVAVILRADGSMLRMVPVPVPALNENADPGDGVEVVKLSPVNINCHSLVVSDLMKVAVRARVKPLESTTVRPIVSFASVNCFCAGRLTLKSATVVAEKESVKAY